MPSPAASAATDDRDPPDRRPPVRLLHLSDLHFRAETAWDQDPVRTALIEDLGALRESGLGPDLVCVAGDIAWAGKAEEYQIAGDWLRERLLPAVGLGAADCFVVPGNHDVDRDVLPTRGARALARELLAEEDPQAVAEALGTEADREALLARLGAYRSFAEGFGDRVRLPWSAAVREVAGRRVRVAGLCSSWLCPSTEGSDQGRLLVGQWQAHAALRGASEADLVVALMHHPASWLAAWDARASFDEVVCNAAQLVLHGHLEGAEVVDRHRPWVQTLIVGAGSAAASSRARNAYQIVEVRPREEVRVRLRTWVPKRQVWVADSIHAGRTDGVVVFRRPRDAAPAETSTDPRAPAVDPEPLRRASLLELERLPPLLVEVARARGLLDITVREHVQAEPLEERGAFAEGRRHARAALDCGEDLPRGPFRLRDLLDRSHRRWVLLGDPGAGKTTVLHRFGLEQHRAGWVVVLLKVADLAAGGLDARLQELSGTGVEAFAAARRAGRALLLLDGLDEVVERDRAGLARVHAELPDAWIVVTSRPTGFDPLVGFRTLQLCPLEPEEQRELLQNLLPEDRHPAIGPALASLAQSPRLSELAGNPLVLTLVGRLLREGRPLPTRRVELYEDVIAHLLTRGADRDERATPYRKADWTAAADALGWMSLGVHGIAGQEVPTEQLRERMRTAPPSVVQTVDDEGGLREFLGRTARGAGLLSADTRSTWVARAWSFAHRTFREYLAARAFVAAPPAERERVVRRAIEQPAVWAEVLALATGRMDDADGFVRELSAAGAGAQPLIHRLLADAEGLTEDTVWALLGLDAGRASWKARSEVLQRLPELVDDGRTALRLAERFARAVSSDLDRAGGQFQGADLWFAAWVCGEVGRRTDDPTLRQEAAEAVETVYGSHRPEARTVVLRWLEDRWRSIPAGRFRMGSAEDEEGRFDDEGPQHEVAVVSGYEMLSVPVTNAVYELFDPGHRSDRHPFEGCPPSEQDAHPVYRVSWYEACAFCAWLGEGVRLPSELEWEYAARGGEQTRYWSGNEETELERVGWVGSNSGGRTHAVGEKPANGYGLHDVHGNVWEWCADEWDREVYRSQASVEPFEHDPNVSLSAGSPGADRVVRGGSWYYEPRWARSAFRNPWRPTDRDLFPGFRLVRVARPPAGS